MAVTPISSTAQRRIATALKAEARRLGFDGCGISTAKTLDDEARRLEEWLSRNLHASMAWMDRHFDKRVDPRKLVDGARSVVSVLHNYYQPTNITENPLVGKISRYAWGDDYHLVLKEKLASLYNWLREEVGDVRGRAFVDSAPVLDKAWAQRSGLGWVGKNANLISRSLGSFFFIGELIVDVELPADDPATDFCGSCTRCIDECPTDAIVEPYVVDSNRCISYLTIEHRGAFNDTNVTSQMGNWIFGCDVCQDVCPWNKFKRPTTEARYLPRPGVTGTELNEWEELNLEAFRARFKDSPVKRAKFEGFLRNVRTAASNSSKIARPGK